jgi:UDP-N-acetylglucosamine acyltransferase
MHQTAVVAAAASIGRDVRIGAYAIVEDDVHIGDECIIGPHAVIRSGVRMGQRNRIEPHAVIGGDPQHLSFDRAIRSGCSIGDDNVFREGVTVNRASLPGAFTRIGDGCYLMNLSHVAHDCELGDGVVMATGVAIGGHVAVGPRAFLGGGCMIHQFARIGELAMVRGLAGVSKDILPFSMAGGEPVRHYRLNIVGLRRAGVDREERAAVERVFRSLRRREALPAAQEIAPASAAGRLLAWLSAPSQRGLSGFITTPGRRDDIDND